MICTISSRTSPLPPGHWCEALSWVWARTPALTSTPSMPLRPSVATVRLTVVIDRLLGHCFGTVIRPAATFIHPPPSDALVSPAGIGDTHAEPMSGSSQRRGRHLPNEPLTEAEFAALRAFDTPTICK